MTAESHAFHQQVLEVAHLLEVFQHLQEVGLADPQPYVDALVSLVDDTVSISFVFLFIVYTKPLLRQTLLQWKFQESGLHQFYLKEVNAGWFFFK